MGQVLHGCAKTTQAVRRAIQNSQESLRVVSERYHLNPKTILKWRKRTFVHDAAMGPKNPHSSVLSLEEEGIIVAFRKHTLRLSLCSSADHSLFNALFFASNFLLTTILLNQIT